MNERIRKLAEQAGMTDDKFGMFFAKDKHDEDGVDLEKFAELIVAECGHLMVDIMLFGGVEPETGYDIMMRHFGVKE